MREISVDSYPIEPTFPSAVAAIADSKSYPPLVKATIDEELVVGSQIVDASWDDQNFLIRFSNGRLRHVSVDPKEKRRNVKWRLLEGEPALSDAELKGWVLLPFYLTLKEPVDPRSNR
jgi:hypothetical protein